MVARRLRLAVGVSAGLLLLAVVAGAVLLIERMRQTAADSVRPRCSGWRGSPKAR